MGQAAQAVVIVAVGEVTIAHQPAVDDGAEHPVEEFLGAPPDQEDGGRGGGEHPQPQQPTVLFPAGLVDMQQVVVADLLEQLLLEHRFEGTPSLVHALVDGRHTQLQAKPVDEKLLDTSAREVHAQRQGADQRHQQRTGQVALAERHTPCLVTLTTPRLGTAPVPATALALVVDVLGLEHLQAGAIR